MLLWVIKRSVCGYFSFQTRSLYFLFDVSYNSSHIRTSSINFSSIFEDKNRQHSLQANTLNAVQDRWDCLHYRNPAGTDRSSAPVTSRQTFSLSYGYVTDSVNRPLLSALFQWERLGRWRAAPTPNPNFKKLRFCRHDDVRILCSLSFTQNHPLKFKLGEWVTKHMGVFI
jgi:hypothetical protein